MTNTPVTEQQKAPRRGLVVTVVVLVVVTIAVPAVVTMVKVALDSVRLALHVTIASIQWVSSEHLTAMAVAVVMIAVAATLSCITLRRRMVEVRR